MARSTNYGTSMASGRDFAIGISLAVAIMTVVVGLSYFGQEALGLFLL